MKRLGVFSDMHCGNLGGLTPPNWQLPQYPQQTEMWEVFEDLVKKYQPFDYAVFNGDLIDGDGIRFNRGTDNLTTRFTEQINMAVGVVNLIAAPKTYIVTGTTSHTGNGQDFEKGIHDILSATGNFDDIRYRIELNLLVDRIGFNFKHFTSRSIVPHGRHTGPARDAVWKLLKLAKSLKNQENWENLQGFPKQTFCVRSHVHYFTLAKTSYYNVITTPMLQHSSAYGKKQHDDIVDWGFLVFDIEDDKVSLEDVIVEIAHRDDIYVS